MSKRENNEAGPVSDDAPLRVVVADAGFIPHRKAFESELPAGTQVVWLPGFDEAAAIAALPGAHVVVGPKFTTGMGAVADSLRLVHVGGAGIDGIDPKALPAGVVCANTYHHEDSIAEYIVAMSIAAKRRLLFQDRELRSGRWASPTYERDLPQLSTLQGAVVGIVGYGHIGARAWRLMRSFGAEGVAVSRRALDANAEGLRWTAGTEGLDRLLSESDVVVLCLPLSAPTHHLINAERLARMKSDAVLVNVSRGPLVDPDALFAALRGRTIGGAVQDVWYRYPTAGSAAKPADQPFDELDNIIMTPHISGVTRQTFEGRARDIARNIDRLHRGEPLRNVVIGR